MGKKEKRWSGRRDITQEVTEKYKKGRGKMVEKWWMREEKREIGEDKREKKIKWIYKSISINSKSPSLAPKIEDFGTFEISN